MPSPTTIADFFGLIRKSGLIDEQTLANVAIGLPREPTACADALVAAELLTPFQAKQLLCGRCRGLVLGPYRILRPLGKGGMGVVYLAEHAALGRKVAVKVLTEEQSHEQLALERFFREARAAAALDHPNIVRLHDISEIEGTHFLVMEFVDGTDLQALLEQTGPLHAAQAANYIAQAAAGLRHAHDRGFIHRDIKPANLIIGKNGVVKVLDMGLARSLSNPKDSLTGQLNEEVITGTADFLSPEQALNVKLDIRTDIYSLGATFYTLLTGRPPYEGSTGQKLAQHQMAAPPDPRVIRAEIPGEMAAVVAKMMAKQPAERYQTASEVIAALVQWVPGADPGSGVTVSLQTAATTTDMRALTPTQATEPRSGRERRAAWVAGGGVILTAGILYAVLGWSKSGHNQAPSPEPPTVLSPAQANDLRWLAGHASHVNDVVFSPDEKRLASIDWSGRLIIWDTRTGKRLHETLTRPGARALVCTTSPDGRFVLVGGERMPILVYEWATGHEVREYPAHANGTWGLAVSPSGQQLLSSGADGSVVLRNLPAGDEVHRFEFGAKMVWSVAFSADGTKIAAGGGEGPTPEASNLIRVWATADGKQLHQFTGHTWDVRSVAFRSDGKALATGSFDGSVRLWDLNTNTEIRTVGTHDGVVERVFFLPDGRLLTCGGPMQDARPNGEGSAIKLWNAETGQELKCWRGENWSELISLAPSRTGTIVAAGGRDRNVRLWSLTDVPVARPDQLIHAFDFTTVKPFKFVYQNGKPDDPNVSSSMPNGVFLHCWKRESVSEFRLDSDAGRPWIGVTNLKDEISSQVIFQFDEGLNLPVVPGRRYRVKLEYRTTGEAEGRALIRNPKNGDFSSIADTRLDQTEGKWKTVEIIFQRPVGGKIDVCMVNNAVGEGNTLAVRAVEVFESGPEK